MEDVEERERDRGGEIFEFIKGNKKFNYFIRALKKKFEALEKCVRVEMPENTIVMRTHQTPQEKATLALLLMCCDLAKQEEGHAREYTGIEIVQKITSKVFGFQIGKIPIATTSIDMR